ncbi:MAG: hypothetical protein ABSE48_11720 [Verrucomicrobiota bacterium]
MIPAAKPNKIPNVIRRFIWGPGLIYVFSRFIPCHPTGDFPLNEPFDNIWVQILHVAFAEHLQFGREVVFTYGPWGFLARGYYPATYLVSMAAWLALSLVFVCAGWRVARYFTDNEVKAWIGLICFTAVTGIPSGNDISNRLTAWGVLLLFLHFFVEERAFSPLQAVLAFTLGWLGLVKFTGLVEGGLLVSVVAADNIIRQRRFPWIVPVWLAGILFFWLLAGQQPGLLWPFMKNSWEVANGYTDAMCQGDLWVLNPLIYLLIGAGYCWLGIILIRPPRRVAGIFFSLGIGGILFLSFKQGEVRNDNGHEMTTAITLLLIGLASLAVAAVRKKFMMLVAAGLVCAATLFASFAVGYPNPPFGFFQELIWTFSPYNLFAPLAGACTNRLRVDYEKQRADLREITPLKAVQGGTDLYSFCQNALFANGLDYRPRPAIQSYSAYTPYLAEMNADWLRTDRAAPNLFFAVQQFDSRFPSQDDGLSWPELLTRYDIKGLSSGSGKYLCLSRSPTPRAYRLKALQEATVTLGRPFDIPSMTNGPVWADIGINKTFEGDLLSVFYKPTILLADLKLADGSEQVCRLIPGIVRAGFLLSPYIADNSSFQALATADKAVLSRKAILAMTILENGQFASSFCYQPQIKIKYYRLEFPAQGLKSGIPQNLPEAGR